MLFILGIALFPYYGDSSGAILEVPSEALLHLSVFSRSSVGGRRQGIREVKERRFSDYIVAVRKVALPKI